MFLGHVTSRNGDVAWPPHYPDLSPCDYLWGYLEHNVYENRPHTIYKLQDSIRTAVLQIPVDMLRRTTDFLRRCAEDCLQNSGAHLTDIVLLKELSHGMLFCSLHKSVSVSYMN
jgi:hypothetical protein